MISKSNSPIYLGILSAVAIFLVFGKNDTIAFERVQENEYIFEKNEIKNYAKCFYPNLNFMDIDSFILENKVSAKYIETEKKDSILTFKNKNSLYFNFNDVGKGSYVAFMKELEKKFELNLIDTLWLDIRNVNFGDEQEVFKIAMQLENEKDAILGKKVYFNGQENELTSSGKVFFPVKYIRFIVNEKTGLLGEVFLKMFLGKENIEIIGSQTMGAPWVNAYFPLSSKNYVKMPIAFFMSPVDSNETMAIQPIQPTKKMTNEAVQQWVSTTFPTN